MPQGSIIDSERTPPPNAIRRPGAIAVQCQAFCAAVQFLTRVPMPARFIAGPTHDGPRLQIATIYFPLVGAFVGLATGIAIWLASLAWPIWLAVPMGIVVEVMITGALHEDALADCCDALGGGWTRADVLRILDDSRLGTYGVLGLMFALVLRGAAIASLDVALLLPAVVASAAIGRWAMIVAMAWLAPLADRPSLAQQAGRQTFRVHVLFGACLAFVGCLPLAIRAPGRLAMAIGTVLAVTAWFVSYLRRRIGGTTGDAVGAVCYVSQIVVVLCCSLRWPSQ